MLILCVWLSGLNWQPERGDQGSGTSLAYYGIIRIKLQDHSEQGERRITEDVDIQEVDQHRQEVEVITRGRQVAEVFVRGLGDIVQRREMRILAFRSSPEETGDMLHTRIDDMTWPRTTMNKGDMMSRFGSLRTGVKQDVYLRPLSVRYYMVWLDRYPWMEIRNDLPSHSIRALVFLNLLKSSGLNEAAVRSRGVLKEIR
mmetsp:Transcript_3265/g.7889  ORF Transcript_3265/g.7889 Transcript_3265/m.7889 type:complete len:200 (+) Transcript_3265:499-1098(+)